jgi:predicted GIY-YIG superfamily endonuclease
MSWVYILRCEYDYFYVGVTSDLIKCYDNNYQEKINRLNTSRYSPEEIVAIYKVNTICKFMDYNEYVSKIIDGFWHENDKGFKLRDFNDENDEYYYEPRIANLCAENNITECLMTHKKDVWNKIIGGKYTRFDIEYKYPDNYYIKDLPLCKCGLPCDIKKNEDKNYLYFRCAKKNLWDNLSEKFDIDDESCNFFMEYTKDTQVKIQD